MQLTSSQTMKPTTAIISKAIVLLGHEFPLKQKIL